MAQIVSGVPIEGIFKLRAVPPNIKISFESDALSNYYKNKSQNATLYSDMIVNSLNVVSHKELKTVKILEIRPPGEEIWRFKVWKNAILLLKIAQNCIFFKTLKRHIFTLGCRISIIFAVLRSRLATLSKWCTRILLSHVYFFGANVCTLFSCENVAKLRK